jgi:hypothetical protein
MSNSPTYTRRKAIKTLSASGLAATGLAFKPALAQYENLPPAAINIENWNPVRQLTPVKPNNLVINAAVTTVDVGNGTQLVTK